MNARIIRSLHECFRKNTLIKREQREGGVHMPFIAMFDFYVVTNESVYFSHREPEPTGFCCCVFDSQAEPLTSQTLKVTFTDSTAMSSAARSFSADVPVRF